MYYPFSFFKHFNFYFIFLKRNAIPYEYPPPGQLYVQIYDKSEISWFCFVFVFDTYLFINLKFFDWQRLRVLSKYYFLRGKLHAQFSRFL